MLPRLSQNVHNQIFMLSPKVPGLMSFRVLTFPVFFYIICTLEHVELSNESLYNFQVDGTCNQQALKNGDAD